MDFPQQLEAAIAESVSNGRTPKGVVRTGDHYELVDDLADLIPLPQSVVTSKGTLRVFRRQNRD